MARFILKWRYFSAGSKKHSENLVKYIATREGVDKCDKSWMNEPATREQQKLIKEILTDFPTASDSFEYQDYQSEPTKYNASEFISRAVEEYADIFGKKENYVGYIAMRPRVEKQGSHGLFSQNDDPIVLDKIAKEVANHDGRVWTTILSLRREDAEKLGYDNANAWRTMLRSQADVIAKAMGIPLSDLKWYAAFHNEGKHPHVHLVSYSIGKEPYMTEKGLMNFKSDLAREIFKNDLFEIYQEQTMYRDELRQTAKERMADIATEISRGTYENTAIMLMFKSLSEELKYYQGKRVYGYMPPKIKNLINGIVDELATDNRIAELYELWYQQKENTIRTYQETMPERVPLSMNKEFKPLKNAVIKETYNFIYNRITFEDDVKESETEARENLGGQLYARAKKMLNISSEYYNPERAVELLRMSAMQGFHWADYQLGKMYLYGQEVEKNISLGLMHLNSAAQQGNQYAQNIINHYNSSPNNSGLFLASLRLFARLTQIAQVEKDNRDKTGRDIDRKLMRKIEEKKMAHGQKMGG